MLTETCLLFFPHMYVAALNFPHFLAEIDGVSSDYWIVDKSDGVHFSRTHKKDPSRFSFLLHAHCYIQQNIPNSRG